jgi:hypothetical protein
MTGLESSDAAPDSSTTDHLPLVKNLDLAEQPLNFLWLAAVRATSLTRHPGARARESPARHRASRAELVGRPMVVVRPLANKSLRPCSSPLVPLSKYTLACSIAPVIAKALQALRVSAAALKGSVSVSDMPRGLNSGEDGLGGHSRLGTALGCPRSRRSPPPWPVGECLGQVRRRSQKVIPTGRLGAVSPCILGSVAETVPTEAATLRCMRSRSSCHTADQNLWSKL